MRVQERREAPFRLDADQRRELTARLEEAVRRARSHERPVLASLTIPVPAELDACAAIFAARRPDDRWFCWEQPDSEGFALAGLGAAATVGGGQEPAGAAGSGGRFTAAAAACEGLMAEAATDEQPDPGAPDGSGPVWLGGFAFAAGGCGTPQWEGLPDWLLMLPELSLARSGAEARLTLNLLAGPDDLPEQRLAAGERRLAELSAGSIPLIDPDPEGEATVTGAMPPEHYEHAVGDAVELIRAGELEKVVLAREVRVHAPLDYEPAALFDGLRVGFPSCYCYCVGAPGLAFVGASPELLVRRHGARATTVALAGSERRSADPAVDAHLGEQLLRSAKDRSEQAIVTRQIERALRPLSVWVTAADEPAIVKVANVQHLATPIRAQLREPRSAVELAGALHPTPAVGGEPWERARELIPALEGLDRGWYAGPLGWMDATGDGELCVALRCALLRGAVAHCYAGVGVVADSDPASELAETELKLQALLPLLAG